VTKAPRTPTRRQEYAEATRQAIIDAARRLFSERGYFATKVADIATEARVAPATVYAVTGGKQGLLDELITIWTTDPIVAATVNHTVASSDPVEMIHEIAAATCAMREQWEDIIRLLLNTAPNDAAVAERLSQVTSIYRSAFVPPAERLAELGALRSGMNAAHAVDVLWFYFGYSSYFTLHDDNGWSYAQASRWMADQVCHELLAGRRGARRSSPFDQAATPTGHDEEG
jgi:AcrR family transcriptional regulator